MSRSRKGPILRVCGAWGQDRCHEEVQLGYNRAFPPMSSGHFPSRCGDYVYDVAVSKTEELPTSRRYKAHVENVERLAGGRLESVRPGVPDAYGATVEEARASVDTAMRCWIRDQSGVDRPLHRAFLPRERKTS
jgi:hypothetical protein